MGITQIEGVVLDDIDMQFQSMLCNKTSLQEHLKTSSEKFTTLM